MRSHILHLFLGVAASFLSGILLALSFPSHNLHWMAWIGLVPLILAVYGRGPIRASLLSTLAGVIFFVGICGWILQSPGYRLLHHVLAGVFLGAPFGLFGLAFAFICKRHGGTLALVSVPFLWVSMEYLRSNFSFLSLPLGLLAHSQYLHPPLIQHSALAGAYGVSFTIAMVNSAAAGVILSFSPKRVRFWDLSFSRFTAIWLVGASSVMLFAALFYGNRVLADKESREGIKVAVVQGNIDQKMKWNPKYSKYIIETYTDLTKKASGKNPSLIVWPEAATPHAINLDQFMFAKVKQLVQETGTPLLLGSTKHRKFKEKGSNGKRFKNSAFLIIPGKRNIDQEFSKIVLVPFGEYVPMEGVIPWSWIKVPKMASYAPGDEMTVFTCADFRFSATICWESLFPDLVREFVNRGAQFMVNITNESWYRDTGGPYQFLAANVFRAVENGVYVVRCANTGISCFIDRRGRIVGRVLDDNGRDTYVRGVLTRTVVPGSRKTVYTRYGDWLIWISLGWAAILMASGVFRKQRHKERRQGF